MMAPIAISPWQCVSSLDTLLIWLNSGVCSQNPAHSFWLEGRPLPLCARDLGLFGGFLLASLLPVRRQPRWLLALAPLLVDGANSFAYDTISLSLYTPTNTLRLLTGTLAGSALALALPRLGVSPLMGAIAMAPLAGPNAAIALLGTVGVLTLLGAANCLAKPSLSRNMAFLLALPELAALAFTKQALTTLIR